VRALPTYFSLTAHVYCAGSNVIVAGTAIFNAENPEQVIQMLKNTVDAGQARIAASK
jgi:ribulose-phosphate 3-epimerase